MNRSGEWICDTPRCGATRPAAAVAGDRRLLRWRDSWEVLEDGAHPAAHLCPECREKRAAGVLADPRLQVCARCGFPTQEFARVPVTDETPPVPVREGRAEMTVCTDCRRPEDGLLL